MKTLVIEPNASTANKGKQSELRSSTMQRSMALLRMTYYWNPDNADRDLIDYWGASG